MDRTTALETTIRQVLTHYLQQLQQPANQHIQFEAIIDSHGKHYQIVALGWENDHRIFNLLFHLDIINNKIWVQEDKMEQSIAELLVEHGIPKKDIVLAYFPDYHRQYTEYAMG
jgi:hypothetical protein